MKIAQVKLATEKSKISIEAEKKVVEQMQKAAQAKRDAFGRQEEGLNIQKDLYDSIGAPFEMVLEIEQQMVELKRQEAAHE